jgi:hypothetical protein
MLPDAELQFAIYPWDYGKNASIHDISVLPAQFRARDILGSDREISAESLEGLVAALATEPSGDKAMLRWIRPFAEMPTEVLDDRYLRDCWSSRIRLRQPEVASARPPRGTDCPSNTVRRSCSQAD